jgi:hypothetical protein
MPDNIALQVFRGTIPLIVVIIVLAIREYRLIEEIELYIARRL